MAPSVKWPEGKSFAFTITDDTDNQTLDDGPHVYAFLRDLGFRTTKLLWPIAGLKKPTVGGLTCDDPAYRAWCLRLEQEGFEAGLHNVTYHDSQREEVRAGLARFEELFGHRPYTFANHVGCAENIYWDEFRLSGVRRSIYSAFREYNKRPATSGHVEDSPFFWGDLCRDNIQYVRGLTFQDANVFQVTESPVFQDAARPYVRNWFVASGGADAREFCQLIGEESQDRLERDGGLCIVYTHLASGFFVDGNLQPVWRKLMERLAKKNGWFVPAKVILDHVVQSIGSPLITASGRRKLEHRWIAEKLRHSLRSSS